MISNTEKTLKNSTISVFAQIITLLLQFINRRIFIIFLDIEYLGYQTLFGNVFSLLSVAELGIGNIIAFHLYKEIAEDNKEEIGKLMYLYKWLYRIVAMIVLFSGLGCCFLLRFFVTDIMVSWSYLYTIYFIQLAGVVLGYFLSYRRTIYIATQQEYKCVQIDLCINVLIQIIQFSLLAIFRIYILYLCLQLSITIISNIIISIRTNKEFPYLKKKYRIAKEDIAKRSMFSDMENLLIHQISYAIYGGTDNVIISAFCGIRKVALYGNYITVKNGVSQILFYKLLNPIQATIGNIVYSNRKKEDLWEQFNVLDVFSYFFASYIGLGFLVFYQPFITIWIGSEYLLSDLFVALFSVTIYLNAVFEIVYKYRTVFGNYKQDRNMMILSAMINLIISIPGAIWLGISGVQMGTMVAFLPIAFGRIRFVVGGFFEQSIKKYLKKHFLLLLLVVTEGLVCYLICNSLPISGLGFFVRGIVWIFIPLFINILVNFRNLYFYIMVSWMRKIIESLFTKIYKKRKK